MAKIVTEKSQIPKWYQKQIKNFNKLTPNQAIYEYELIKLQRRAGKEFGNFLKGYYQRPKVVRQKDIEEIRQFRGIKLKKAKQGIKPKKITYNYPAMSDYKREERWRKEEEADRLAFSRKENGTDYTPDYSWDLEEEARQEVSVPEPQKTYESVEQYLKETGQKIDPDTGEVVPYESVEDYLKNTNQTVDPTTGEVLDKQEYIANQLDLIKEFFDDLRTEIDNFANQTIIVNSTYRNGRTRNANSRQWITDNVNRAKGKLITLIDSIEADEDRSISVYERFANDSSALSDLQDAISEYMAKSYGSLITDSGSDMNYQRVYAMLSGSPMTLEDSEEFEV